MGARFFDASLPCIARERPELQENWQGRSPSRARGWLHGMISPRSGDPVFDAQMRACGLTARAKEAFDSIEVRPRARDESQIHREFVVFDESQVYPEFIVQYRTDTPEEEARLVRIEEGA